MEWNFNHEESTGFKPIPVGDYRVRIAEAERAVSSNGNDMLTLKLDVSGHKSKLWYYITFMPDNPSITNRMLTQVFSSFKGIEEGDLNEQGWIGKVGACHVKHEEYPKGSGEMQAKVHYFISADKQDSLPPWQEPEKDEVKVDDDGFIEAVGDGNLPF